jgi:hypothetical protein
MRYINTIYVGIGLGEGFKSGCSLLAVGRAVQTTNEGRS